MDLDDYLKKAMDRYGNNALLVSKLKKQKPKNLDQILKRFHNEVFAYIDCIECNNCCKSISPIVTDRDIQRIAKYLKIKPGGFLHQYLKLDREGDYVFRIQPCPFLGQDGLCMIYNSRPKACAEYPHTDRKKFYQILDLSLKNSLICPAVAEVFDKLKKVYN